MMSRHGRHSDSPAVERADGVPTPGGGEYVNGGRVPLAVVKTNVVAAMSASESKLYLVLCAYADWRTGECFPSQATLAARTGLNPRTVRRARDSLVAKGLIQVTGKGGRAGDRGLTSTYRVLSPGQSYAHVERDVTRASEDSHVGNSQQSPGQSYAHQTALTENEQKRIHTPQPLVDAERVAEQPEKHLGGEDPEQVRALFLAHPRPGKRNRADIDEAIAKALAEVKGRGQTFEWLLSRVRAYAKSALGRDQQRGPAATKWFADGRYDDDDIWWSRVPYSGQNQRNPSRLGAEPGKYDRWD